MGKLALPLVQGFCCWACSQPSSSAADLRVRLWGFLSFREALVGAPTILKYLARSSPKKDELYGSTALAACQVRTPCIFLIVSPVCWITGLIAVLLELALIAIRMWYLHPPPCVPVTHQHIPKLRPPLIPSLLCSIASSGGPVAGQQRDPGARPKSGRPVHSCGPVPGPAHIPRRLLAHHCRPGGLGPAAR